MPIGVVLLGAVVVLTLLGLLHRVYDRMYLTDTQALVFLVLIIGGSFISLPISDGRIGISLNIGGGVIPLMLALYVLTRANSTAEWVRATLATLITAAVLYGTAKLMAGAGHGRSALDILDPVYLYGLIAGVIAYVAGRSRRSAFIAATVGTVLLDIANLVELVVRRMPGRVAIGGAGAFDVEVIAGLIAVLLAELVGESRERLQGGPTPNADRKVELVVPGKSDDPAQGKDHDSNGKES
ncbi:MAG: DUF1614 domain-containing protein [Syntrophothermus sp.]